MAKNKKHEDKSTTLIDIKSDFINSKKNREVFLTEERVRASIPTFTEYVSFWREYPDMFIDMIKGPDSKFNFSFTKDYFYVLL